MSAVPADKNDLEEPAGEPAPLTMPTESTTLTTAETGLTAGTHTAYISVMPETDGSYPFVVSAPSYTGYWTATVTVAVTEGAEPTTTYKVQENSVTSLTVAKGGNFSIAVDNLPASVAVNDGALTVTGAVSDFAKFTVGEWAELNVDGDVTVSTGTVNLNNVTGDVTVTDGTAVIRGNAVGKLTVSGGKATVEKDVTGDVEASGGETFVWGNVNGSFAVSNAATAAVTGNVTGAVTVTSTSTVKVSDQIIYSGTGGANFTFDGNDLTVTEGMLKVEKVDGDLTVSGADTSVEVTDKVTGTISGLTENGTTPITLTAKEGQDAPKNYTYGLTTGKPLAETGATLTVGGTASEDKAIHSIMLSVPAGVTLGNLEQFDGTVTAVFPNAYRVDFAAPITAEEANTYFKNLAVSADKAGDYTVGAAILGVSGYTGAFPAELNSSVGATGSFTFTKETSGGSSGGSTGGNHSGNTGNNHTVVDPDQTGVSDLLNTDDHMAYLHGYDTGHFGPSDNMTRAQAAQMFYNLLRNKDVTVTVDFSDIPDGVWYEKAANTLASMGIMVGVGGGNFAPDRPITRAEFTVAAMRFAKLPTDCKNIFPDVKESDWFYDQVVGSIQYGWITGYPDGNFHPNNTITRAEVTTIVNRMLGRSADKAFVDGHVDFLRLFPDVSKKYWAYYDIVEATNAHDHTGTDAERWTGLN